MGHLIFVEQLSQKFPIDDGDEEIQLPAETPEGYTTPLWRRQW